MCGSLLVRCWQHISVLFSVLRCAGWQGRPELEQADGIRVTGMSFLTPKLPVAKGIHLNRAEPGNLLLGSHLSLARSCLLLKHYPCGISPSFFFSPHSPRNAPTEGPSRCSL